MNICVFLSAYDESGTHAKVVTQLGAMIGKAHHTLVFGGSNRGLMRVLADSVERAGGNIIALSAEIYRAEVRHGISETIIAKTVSERKVLLLDRSDAFIILPGGLGTLDELTEIMESKKVYLHDKPIIIVNLDGFYDGFKVQLERMHGGGFIPRPLDELVRFVNTAQEAMHYL